MPVEHFKSKEGYRKSRAYTHIHGIPTHAKEVVVAGKKHKVKHSDKKLGIKKGKGASGRTGKFTGKRKRSTKRS